MNYLNRYQKEFSTDIIALFCDIDHCLFLKDKQIVAYSKGRNSAGWIYVIFDLQVSQLHR